MNCNHRFINRANIMINKQTYSILQFCEAHNISRAKFYLLLNEGKAPKLMKVGRRRLISMESAADWRKMMEANDHTTTLLNETRYDTDIKSL